MRSRSVTAVRRLAVVLVVPLIVAASGGDDETTVPATDETTVVADEPQSGGELRIMQQSLAATLDPALMRAAQAAGQGNEAFAIFGALLLADNESGEMQPLLAESLESTDEGTTWLLTLRPDMTFTDGTPFDAEAVKFNWDRIANPDTASPGRGTLAEIASYEVIDPVTLEIVLNAQNTMFPRLFTSPLTFIGSPTALAADAEAFASQPVGAGPFMVESYVRDSQLTLVRNPDYFDAPRPYVDSVVFSVNPDEEQRYRSVTAGESDMMIATARAKEQTAKDDGLGVLATPQAMVGFISFNTTRAPTDDIRVRTAFAMSIDTAALCQARNGGVECPDPLPRGLFSEGSPFYEADQELPAFDPAGAQALIDEYLQELGLDSIDVAISVAANPEQTNLATVVQANLSELDGVNVSVNPLELTALIAAVQASDVQLASGTFNGAYPYQGIREYLVGGAGFNGLFGNPYSSPEIDAALAQAQSTFDPDEQADAFRTVARQVAEDVLFAPRDQPVFNQIYNTYVQGVATWADNILRTDLVWMEAT